MSPVSSQPSLEAEAPRGFFIGKPMAEIESVTYRGPDRRDDHWHVRKEINVGHMLTTIMIIVAALAWSNTIDKRVTVLESKQDNQTQQTAEMRAEMRAGMESVNNKLDRIVERLIIRGK